MNIKNKIKAYFTALGLGVVLATSTGCEKVEDVYNTPINETIDGEELQVTFDSYYVDILPLDYVRSNPELSQLNEEQLHDKAIELTVYHYLNNDMNLDTFPFNPDTCIDELQTDDLHYGAWVNNFITGVENELTEQVDAYLLFENER
jgi:hypothetical protein